ncbi:MFS transporter [Catenulispora sp. NF23]|uniref:MFS transporter n=1 Tax=Catenulispora pinistramenti TaxID=2705254 RepID=A0ABS5L6Q2_9ACTN|nr:MFS transporter [Catenulispora pinistramenti]MBS2539856.1 MFS transporter [Catenulispora pinistramenti]MBS2553800.1 MFS transporter [Catenulispora pinistramenti]
MTDAEKVPLPRLFWLFFAAGAVSWLGDGVIVVGFPLLAAGLTGSPLGIAAVVVTQRLAPMLLSLPAGALADRWNARVTVIATNAAQAVLFAVAALLVSGNHIGLAGLILIAFLADALGTLFTCSNSALLADVVEPKHFGRANTWLRATNAIIAFVIGPGVGGLLYSTGRQLPLLIDACSFVAAAVVLSTLRLPNARPRPKRTDRHFVAEVKEGVRISFGSAPMRLMAGMVGTMTLAQAGSVAAIVVLGTHTVGLGKSGFGWTLAAGNIAAVAVMLSIGRLTKLRTSSAVLVSLAFGIVGEVLLGTAHSGPQISLGLALDGAAALIVGITLTTARMRLVPREQLGRMTGGYQTVMYAAGTVGTIIGGALAESSGRLPYLVCAAIYAALLATSFRRVRGLDVEAAPASAAVPAQSPAADEVDDGAPGVQDVRDAPGVPAGEVVD